MENQAVRLARSQGDTGVLLIGLVVIIGVMMTVFFIGLAMVLLGSEVIVDALKESDPESSPLVSYLVNSSVYVIIAIVILLLTMFMIRIMRQQFLGNYLQVEYSNYAWMRDWSNKVAVDLQMPRVEMFVGQDPYINAYAIGFARPYNIVFNSATIRYLTKEELKVIIVHEMAHVKYHHTQIATYLSMVTSLPFVGGVSSWTLGFWQRRTELTADRLALLYMGDPEIVKRALIKVHVGPDVASSFNQTARDWQAYNSNNLMNRFAQTLGSHPFLARRIQHIDTNTHLLQRLQVPQADRVY